MSNPVPNNGNSNLTITNEDLIKALSKLLEDRGQSGNGMTSAEIAIALGIGDRKALVLLQKLNAKGQLVSHRVYRYAIDGRYTPVPTYQLRPGCVGAGQE